ncbi:Gfo/Idh/MocA family protein [Evansella cellulosilytica]|uniref:Oxidoreductase domain protein n=1 Tax=Evansella cellulosilytica (strain ATCC 21833 / DSM 2522 / FERM P-1141 / JCM 9156 / N-4) TaxID=649639 RepID=E6TZ82_EVAC2|nr:oxidoreductase domain protein [Evansella cellulosilytica DSM 2522]
MMNINWGIIGTGGIASKFANDLSFAKSAAKYAVGSRTLESAEKFAEEHSFSRAYGSYEELAADRNIDAIYVATPHPYHKENVLTCLRAGKAVLCEKPFTMNAGELEELIIFAREKKLFLMEAMWTRYLPTIKKVNEWVNNGSIGEVRHINAEFGFNAPWDPNGRLLNKQLGGGALLDVGIYPLSFASMILGTNPEKILSTAFIGDTGVDEQFSITLSYEGGNTASLHGAIRVDLSNHASIHGTEGTIHIPSFFMASNATLKKKNGEVEIFQEKRASLGYQFEIEEVGHCIHHGLMESPIMPLNESLEIMKLMDKIKDDWNLSYMIR